MVEIDSRLVDDISIHDESFEVTDLVRMLERQLPDSRPGVPREIVEAYADALDYDRSRVTREFEARLVDTDVDEWQAGGKLYPVGENVSTYPAEWHDAVSDPQDLRELIRLMAAQVESTEGIEMTVTDEGVAQRSLLLAVEAMTGLDRVEGRRVLHRHRDRGEIHLTATQNPEASIRLLD